jgi:hypothetical protein
VAVPGPIFDFAGRVIVCGNGSTQDFPKLGASSVVPLPWCNGNDEAPSIIVISATFWSMETWFIFLQNQFGDLPIVKPDDASGIEISHFDTILAANSIIILR